MSRLDPPVVIDEIQKAPAVFDALKAVIDKKRVPGRYYLTGSTQFSARVGIRESLTGRIGLLQLFPFTLAELHQKAYQPPKPLQAGKARFSIAEFSRGLSRGGMPVPRMA